VNDILEQDALSHEVVQSNGAGSTVIPALTKLLQAISPASGCSTLRAPDLFLHFALQVGNKVLRIFICHTLHKFRYARG
jgi:hypothetical protein